MKSLGRFVVGAVIAAWTAYALGERAINAFAPGARAAAAEVPKAVEPAVAEAATDATPRRASEVLDDLATGAGGLARSSRTHAVTAVLVAALVSLVAGYRFRPTLERRRENREIRRAQWRQQQRERDLRLLAAASARGNTPAPAGNGTSGAGAKRVH